SLGWRYIGRGGLGSLGSRPQDAPVCQGGDRSASDRADPVDPVLGPEVMSEDGGDDGWAEAAGGVHAGAADRSDGHDVERHGEPDGEPADVSGARVGGGAPDGEDKEKRGDEFGDECGGSIDAGGETGRAVGDDRGGGSDGSEG